MLEQQIISRLNELHEDKRTIDAFLKSIETEGELAEKERAAAATKVAEYLHLEEYWRQWEPYYSYLEDSFQKLHVLKKLITNDKKNSDKSHVEKKITERDIKDIPKAMLRAYLPTIKDVHAFFKSERIIGEEATQLLLLFGVLSQNPPTHLAIEGISSTGKTELLTALLQVLPKEKVLLLQQASDKALFNNAHINTCDYIVVTELQKVIENSTAKEILKNLSENKDATYDRTIRKGDTEKCVVTAGKTVLYTFAITNDYFKNIDDEFRRRFVVLSTDISKEQTERVLRGGTPEAYRFKDEFIAYIGNCLRIPYSIENPFKDVLIEALPEELKANPRTRTFKHYYEQLVKGSVLFHHGQRMRSHNTIFATLRDNQLIWENYGPFFYDNTLGVTVLDRLVLDVFEQHRQYTQKEIIERAEAQINLRTSVYTRCLNNLNELRLIETQNGTYVRLKEARMPQLSWEMLFEKADLRMKEKYPNIYGQWHEMCIKDLEEKNGIGTI